ncbi:MAG: M15 family metallopeptidase [Balneolaceae bacterium]|nr:M15 family metallopeptidase [Balneolaceae bacterium]MBO6547374.1 M15 family metallopeptidase [Balneolaceae bacterium]MBO6647679.1 M15 family metallopeptidase [Balneolaceae bacterium]
MGFTIKQINKDRLLRLKESSIWGEECPVHYSRLRIAEVQFVDFDNQVTQGELIVLEQVAESVVKIFQELLELKFPIEKMLPMEEFCGDDVLSMKANNSSAYNGRKVARTDRWSSHAYGCAIDINPIQNPYLLLNEHKELVEVIPFEGENYLDRSNQRKGMIEEVVPVFVKHRFSDWGGSWEAKPDYHHFQLPWSKIDSLFSK